MQVFALVLGGNQNTLRFKSQGFFFVHVFGGFVVCSFAGGFCLFVF